MTWRALAPLLAFLLLAAFLPPGHAAASPLARFLVELDAPAAVDLLLAAEGRAGLGRPAPVARPDFDSPPARAVFEQIAAQQQQVARRAMAAVPGTTVERHYGVLLNALAVRAPVAAAGPLSRVPGVRAVTPDRPYRLANAPDIVQIGAPELWRQVGGSPRDAGRGVKVAIIDSGIATTHPSFDPTGYAYPPGFPKGDTRFTTPKVIAARAYFRPDDPPRPGEDTPLPGPNGDSHGTHVASIVAGNAGVVATVDGVRVEISGVAPGAYLMNYRVFYPSRSESDFVNGNAFTVELVAALEDAVRDGADVINNSWGSSYAATYGWADPMVRAVEAAVRAGVVVVNAAGNSGPGVATTNSPSNARGVISVGAVTTSREIARQSVELVGYEPADQARVRSSRAAFGPRLTAPIGPLPIALVQPSEPRAACDPLPAGSLAGRVAIIARGICPFVEKARHAQEAGAAAVLIVNSGEQPIEGFGGQAEEIRIPVGMIGRSAGERLQRWVEMVGEAAQLRIDPRPTAVSSTPNLLAEFSSRGPSADRTLTPDVVAPGVNIVAAGYGPAPNPLAGFGQVSGTSMAAPHVAGAAALLRQARPEWSPAQVRAALMATASPEVRDAEGALLPPLARGAGRIDVAKAAAAPLLADPPSLAFGGVSAGQEVTRTVRVTALAAGTYRLRFSSVGAPLPVAVEPAVLSVGRGETVELTLRLSAAGLPAGDYGGDLVLEGAAEARIPIWLRVVPPRDRFVLLLDNDGSEDGGRPNTAAAYRAALDQLKIPYDLFDADEARRPGQRGVPPLSALQRYRVVILFTGSRDSPVERGRISLTEQDQDILNEYLNEGGAILVAGNRVAEALDVNFAMQDALYGRSRLFHGYLGAVVRATVPFPATVRGPAGSPLAGRQFSLSGSGDLAVLDAYREDSDTYLAPETVQAALLADDRPVALVRRSDPEGPEGRPKFAYRSAVLAFGLEQVAEGDRAALLGGILNWLLRE
ncbi:MAG: S8 family serine peptidase [Chloroflexota bacterium]|nr:S8 family serine peptidase [Chloroflexota bacterium]